MTYLSLDELKLRDAERLPRLEDGQLNEERCITALGDAAEIVRTYLPELIGEDGLPLDPPARLAGSLKPIVRDIAMYLLNERPGEESVNARYDRAIKLLIALGGGSAGGSGAAGGPDPLDTNNAELIDGRSEFIPPGGLYH
jgi:phage gp36-like protein